MNAIVLVFLFVYILVIALIAYKLRDIFKNPEKYTEKDIEAMADKLIKKTPYCKIFRSLSGQYVFVPYFIWLALTALETLILYLATRIIAWDNYLILPDTWLFSFSTLFFINIFGMPIFCMHFKNSFFAVAVRGLLHYERYQIWKRGHIYFLIVFVLLFPICCLGTNNYIYYNDSGITSSDFFELGETFTDYNDIKEVEISYSYSYDNELYLKYELVLADGKTMDIATRHCYDENTLYIHKMLEKTGSCNVDIMPLTEEEIKYFQSELPKEQCDLTIYIFEGFH